jgi:Aspartyl protease
MKRERRGPAIGALLLLAGLVWAAQPTRAAHFSIGKGTQRAAVAPEKRGQKPKTVHSQLRATDIPPAPIRFREREGQGLLVPVWVNGLGPFTFAIDTGAGINLVSPELESRLGVSKTTARKITVSGLSGLGKTTREIALPDFSVGEKGNVFPAGQVALVTSLPGGVDGVLDPTTAYLPFGCMIDLRSHRMVGFNPLIAPLSLAEMPDGGVVVRWLTRGAAPQPFVKLDNGELALLDTGSALGLGLPGQRPLSAHRSSRTINDMGGGRVEVRRVQPVTVSVGSLVLRRVPTDILLDAGPGAPIILGRAALYPFRLSFDPLHRLIELAPLPQ